jgi:hypothetical protein
MAPDVFKNSRLSINLAPFHAHEANPEILNWVLLKNRYRREIAQWPALRLADGRFDWQLMPINSAALVAN